MSRAEGRIEAIKRRIAPLRHSLLRHAVYARIDSLPALRLFLQHHVFAVWDFMSLLKALQQRLCCVAVPWVPPEDAAFSRLVNEIVLGEESDVDRHGVPCSHFELYVRAMTACGADTGPISRLIAQLRQHAPLEAALPKSGAPAAAGAFVESTFAVIRSDDVAAIASAFSFGREDLLPDVFRKIVESLSARARGDLDDFRYYLDRHIEVDGGDHGPMSERLIALLCGDDEQKWQRAGDAAEESLAARQRLWDGVVQSIEALRRETA